MAEGLRPLPQRVRLGLLFVVFGAVLYGAGIMISSSMASSLPDRVLQNPGSMPSMAGTIAPVLVGSALGGLLWLWGGIQIAAGLIEYAREIFREP